MQIMTTLTLALIILAAILAQIIIVLLIGLYRRRHQYLALDDRTSGTKDTSKPPNAETRSFTELGNSDLSWQDFKEFVVQRRQVEDGNNSICSFYLEPSDGKPLATFKPGQFLTFKLQIEDPNTHKLKAVVRCYSLSDGPRADYYRVSIKRISAPIGEPDLPSGVASRFFHDHVIEGSRLLIKAPTGHFHLTEDESLPIVLIGGGIGITPMLSILGAVLATEIEREIWFYYGVRSGDEHIMKEHLQTLSSTHDNFHLHVCYSEPNEDDLHGVDFQHEGRVTIALLRSTLKLMRYQFYVCGPRPMMESLLPDLEDWGVNSGDIHYESFGPASLIKHEKTVLKTTEQPITVTFSHSCKSIPWDPDVDSLLAFSEINDIEVESGCRAGSCGSCQTAIASGEVEYDQEPDADLVPGYCLLCISTPKSDLTLDA